MFIVEDQFPLTTTIIADAKQQATRLDRFLQQKIAKISRNRLQMAIQRGDIRVNKSLSKANYKVRAHDHIEICLPEAPWANSMVAEELPLHIIYEDESLLVVNKVAEMVVHPGFGNWTGTLVNGLLYHLQSSSPPLVRSGLVHRIDKGTSGLLVVAKTASALTCLAKQFYKKSVERHYEALVWGTPEPAEGRIDMAIKRGPSDHRVMIACPADDPRGKHAITHYTTIERLGYVTHIRCQLETGRTHQIRAHMKYLGYPLFGDPRYGGNQILKGPIFTKYKQMAQQLLYLMPYQALHAGSLGFLHPVDKKNIYFTAPLPPSFEELLTRWRQYARGGKN